eukprot:gene10745-12533_t
MNILFGLPEILQVTVLTKWLSLKEVGRMDSALCNSKLRSEYLKLLHLEVCIFPRDHGGSIDPEWIIKRAIKLREVHLPNMNSELRMRFLRQLGKSFTESIIVSSKTCNMDRKPYRVDSDFAKRNVNVELELILDGLIEYCSDIKRIEIDFEKNRTYLFSDNVSGSMSNLLSTCKHLQSVTMVSIIFLPVSFVKAICSAHCLEHVFLDRCEFTPEAYTQFTLSPYQNPNVLSYSCSNDTVWLCKAFPALQSFAVDSLHDAACLAIATQSCPLVTSATLYFASSELLRNLHDHLQGAWSLLTFLFVKNQGRSVGLPEKSVLWLILHYKSLVAITSQIETIQLRPTLYPLHYQGSLVTQICICCDDTATLAAIITQCPYLHTLYLVQGVRNNGTFKTITLVPVEQSLHLIVGTNIKAFSLSYYADLTDSDLLQLMHADFHFFRLKKSGKKLSNGTVLSVLASMTNLNTVEIIHCPSLTYEMVTPLPSLCVNLRSVTFESHFCFDCFRLQQSKYPELVSQILRKLYPRVTYWHVVC